MSVAADAATACALSVRKLEHRYARVGSTQTLHVLENIDLDVANGAFVSIIGESGCGKSTLLRLMAGLVMPTGGTILHDGKPVTGLNHELGFVFQKDAVFPWLTVERNIEYGPRCRGVPAAERRRLVDHWCDAVGLSAFRHAYPKELSGGMRKRVDLARVYANSPDVLLMDEPFGALDVQTKGTMQHTVLELWQRTRKTVVFVTHDLDEAAFLSDTVIVMASRPGRIAARICVDLPRPRTESVRVSDAFASVKRSIWTAMQHANSPADANAGALPVSDPAGIPQHG